jgi:hypothetical protein
MHPEGWLDQNGMRIRNASALLLDGMYVCQCGAGRSIRDGLVLEQELQVSLCKLCHGFLTVTHSAAKRHGIWYQPKSSTGE